ncbi:MAG TPA: class I SAM-dependent methyltransferase [Anaeromyxobacter sp.]
MRGVERIPWVYDLGMAIAERSGLRRWREWLVAGATSRALDLGTGTGRNLPLLAAGAAAVGVDPHLASLRRARRRAPGVPLVAARAEALPFRDGAFDTVLSGLVLCSVDDPAAALAEVRRVLRRGGALRALEHVRARGTWGAIQDLIQPAWTAFTGGCHPNRETERAVEAAGFDIEPGTLRARGTMRRFQARGRAGVPGEGPAGETRGG